METIEAEPIDGKSNLRGVRASKPLFEETWWPHWNTSLRPVQTYMPRVASTLAEGARTCEEESDSISGSYLLHIDIAEGRDQPPGAQNACFCVSQCTTGEAISPLKWPRWMCKVLDSRSQRCGYPSTCIGSSASLAKLIINQAIIIIEFFITRRYFR